MSQHDLNIANQTASATRSDINNALQALGSNNSGSSAPSTTYANMHWYDTTNNILKQRSEADDAWINIAYFDQSNNLLKVIDGTYVANTSGTNVARLTTTSQSAWNTGTGTEATLISPSQLQSKIDGFIFPVKEYLHYHYQYKEGWYQAINSELKFPQKQLKELRDQCEEVSQKHLSDLNLVDMDFQHLVFSKS